MSYPLFIFNPNDNGITVKPTMFLLQGSSRSVEVEAVLELAQVTAAVAAPVPCSLDFENKSSCVQVGQTFLAGRNTRKHPLAVT